MHLTQLGILLGLQLSSVHGQANVQDLFIVDSGTCQSLLSSGTLQQWVDESFAMASAGLDMFNIAFSGAAENPPVSKAYFQGLMSIDPSIINLYTSTARVVLNGMVDFLRTGDVPDANKRAYLYCSDSVFQQVSPNSYALQKDGITHQTNDEGQPLTVKQAYSYEFVSGLRRTIPYFVGAPLNQYFFERVLPLNVLSSTQKPCGGYTAGITYQSNDPDDPDEPVILLCPNSILFKPQQATLGSRIPSPVTAKLPGTQSLLYVVPESNTLFHELFHYVPNGQEQVLDFSYWPSGCSKLAKADSVLNAQSYCYLSLGAWYTANVQVNGKTITYASGGAHFLQ